jgi:hypothetical protein
MLLNAEYSHRPQARFVRTRDGRIDFDKKVGVPRTTGIAERFGTALDWRIDSLTRSFGLRDDVSWHDPSCQYVVELVLILHLNATIGGTQNLQLDINHEIDVVETGRPVDADGNQLDE